MLNIRTCHPILARNIKYTLICCSFLFPLQVFSQQNAPNQSPSGWTGQASLSINSSQGNTNLGRLNIGLMAKHKDSTPWQHLIRGSINQSKTAKNRDADKRTTKDIKRLGYKIDYALSDKNAIVGYLGYEEDKKIKLDSEKVAMLGFERHKMGTKNHQFMIGAGVGKLTVKYTDGTEKRSGTAGRLGFGYTGRLTDKLSFKENIVVLYSKERTMKRATSSLNYALTDNVSIALSHEITHRNKIANTATDRNDDVTDLKLIVKF
jgi:putative salt-induced outer membrane protein YdiY